MFYNGGMEPIILKEHTSLSEGLTDGQAAQRKANSQVMRPSKTIPVIIFQHIFTYFNIINFILFGLVLFTGSLQNTLFMGIVLSNLIIGLVQEIRSKRVLDKLALLHQQKYAVLRNGQWVTLDMDKIVQGDILRVEAGMQIPCDGVIVKGECQVNESLLTGESDALDKKPDDSVYAGCYLVSGRMEMQAVLVGQDSYMASILDETRKERRYPSQLRDSLNSIITFCSWIIFPAGLLLFARLFWVNHQPLNGAILSTVASMVGMIPEGLIILTSIALASASLKLAKIEVLVQELYCIENLARVDTLCLDKTGTITSGSMKVVRLIPAQEITEEQCKEDLATLYSALEDDNVTARAIRKWTDTKAASLQAQRLFPFSSSAKCSGAVIENRTLIAGAYSFVFSKEDPQVLAQISELAKQGMRVLVLAQAPVLDKLEKGDWTLLGLVVIEDEIRPDAPEILSYFKKQDVDLKVISGDNPETVEAIARRAGLKGKSIDMSRVSDAQIAQAVEECTIFGRVTPFQKKLMVEALQQQGHTVAMTGDGVNDVMALRQADCSIAMGSGSQAARSVASLVLLEDQFSALPDVVIQGRRVINNIQRTASLFLVKTLFSFGLTLLTIFWMQIYPFVPIQLTLTSFISTGFPGFVLTFEKNSDRVRGNFLVSVLSRAVPGALALICSISAAYVVHLCGWFGMDDSAYRTVCTILAGLNGLGVLYTVCRPLSPLRTLLLCSMGFIFAGALILLGGLFMTVELNWLQLLIAAALCAMDWVLLWAAGQADWHKLLGHLLRTKNSSRTKAAA